MSNAMRRWKMPPKQGYSVLENEWIPITDGTQLAARVWLPESAGRVRVPVVMEYIPYRKDDGTLGLDAVTGDYLAAHGIAFARVDIRGTGDSRGGLLRGEYTEREQCDGLEAIAWLAGQAWSNGAVGMRGYSWGGFNSLQIAARQPPQLRAIMPMCICDDRYGSDMHYLGGALSLANFEWGTALETVMASPPDPALFGPDWKDEWLRRLRGMKPILAEWLTHQTSDDYWKQGSVGIDWSRIKCPVYCVGGWEDAYNESILRALSHLQAPCKALIGPWGHCYPNWGWPGPALDWALEEVRWWVQWLEGAETGIMSEPRFRFFVSEQRASAVYPADTPGYWASEETWPSARIESMDLYMNPGELNERARAPESLSYLADKVVGLQRMSWLPVSAQIGGSGIAEEQSADDQNSLLFESSPLEADFEIVGRPAATLRISADAPVAMVAIRLNEVTPSGQSFQISYAVLNLTHRDSHENPTPLQPGAFYDVDLELKPVAHRFKKGSRIRIAMSEGLWPLVWPSPSRVTLSLMTGASRLRLPIRRLDGEEAPFALPRVPTASDLLQPVSSTRISHPDSAGSVVVEREWPELFATLPERNTRIGGGWSPWRLDVCPGRPDLCQWQGGYWVQFEREGWGCNMVRSSFSLRSTGTMFQLSESISATHDGEIVFEDRWSTDVPRRLM